MSALDRLINACNDDGPISAREQAGYVQRLLRERHGEPDGTGRLASNPVGVSSSTDAPHAVSLAEQPLTFYCANCLREQADDRVCAGCGARMQPAKET